jgi:hypothetical protein
LYTINRNFLRLDFGAELGALKVGVNKNEGEEYVVIQDPDAVRNGGATQVDSEGYLVDQYGERVVDENNEMIYVGVTDGDAFYPHSTSYSPQRGGDAMEGGYESTYKGLDGQSIVRTLDDVYNGRSTYVTLAGDNRPGSSQIGNKYIIPVISYTDNKGQSHTLTNVLAYVHDTGSAFNNPSSEYWRGGDAGMDFDIAVTRDGRPSVANQINTRKLQFIPVQ